MNLTDLIKPEHIMAAYKAPFDDDTATARYRRLHGLIEAICKPVAKEDMAVVAASIHMLDEALEIATNSDAHT